MIRGGGYEGYTMLANIILDATIACPLSSLYARHLLSQLS